VGAKRSVLSIEARFRVCRGGRPVFGPGKARLLEAIVQCGSIAEAARELGMSYMRAWSLVKSLETVSAQPLVERLRGGDRRGGARLTASGHEVLRLYCELESSTDDAIRDATARLESVLAGPPKSSLE
jgi:molybdate transport system regulatory protein